MAMNFPNSPAVGDSFFWKSNTYIWDGVKWTARSAVPQVLSDGFIGAVMWFNGSRATLPNGYIAADGQLIPREDETELFAAVEAGTFATVEDNYWRDASLLDPNYHAGQLRGNYTLGDTGLDFRIPDLNGATENSVIGTFLRGDGNGRYPGIGAVGEVLLNGAPNITGSTNTSIITGYNVGASARGDGCFVPQPVVENPLLWEPTTGNTVTHFAELVIDASLSHGAYGRKTADGVTPTTEVRPNAVTGIWIIRARNVYTGGGTGTGSNSYVSETAPAGAPDGSSWYCTANGLTYIRLNDGDSVQWVESNPTAPNLGEVTPESIGALPDSGSAFLDGALYVRPSDMCELSLSGTATSFDLNFIGANDIRAAKWTISGSDHSVGLLTCDAEGNLAQNWLAWHPSTLQTKIYYPSSSSAQGTTGDALTRKDYVDTTVLLQAERIDALVTLVDAMRLEIETLKGGQ